MKLLTYTPRHERTRAPICNDLDPRNNDPITPTAWWVHDIRKNRKHDLAITGREPLVPVLTISNAPLWSYIDKEYPHAFEWFETEIYFTDRAGYYAAHRIARRIRRGNGIAIIYRDEFPGVTLDIHPGWRHRVYVASRRRYRK